MNTQTTPFILATANPDKAREIIDVLDAANSSITLLERPSRIPEVEETGATLEANARLKAEALVRGTGLPAIAEDTGLEVDALGGAPGVHSARYSGANATYAQNVSKLLDALKGVPPERRTARFATVAIASWPDGSEVVARGTVEGVIAGAKSGTKGFGYDPIFIPTEGDGRTFAEMTTAEKRELSHRGRAIRELLSGLGDGAQGRRQKERTAWQ